MHSATRDGEWAVIMIPPFSYQFCTIRKKLKTSFEDLYLTEREITGTLGLRTCSC